MKWHRTITILGGPNSDLGELSIQSRDRVRAGLAAWREEMNSVFLLTGGIGEHFNPTEIPHTRYLKDALIAEGVPAACIAAELYSTNTFEDISKLLESLERSGDPAGSHTVVTSSFHVKRVTLLISRIFHGFPAPGVLAARDTMPEEDLALLKDHERRAIEKILNQDRV